MESIEEHFTKVFTEHNHRILEKYPSKVTKNDVTLTPEDIQIQIKRIYMDTSAGPDRVLARTIRQLNVANSICSIGNTMLRTSYVPTSFREGKVILADKDGDESELDNWRPITIFSIVRRVIEKALDTLLRGQVEININQRGFIIGVSGCHVNAKLINACLKDAKRLKKDCVVVFLDVSKAFDRIGHDHISQSLQAAGVLENLRNLIMNFITQNNVTIHSGKQSSSKISINCGVPQGAPLSPFFKLSNDYDGLSLAGFADDQAVTSKDKQSAIRIVEAVRQLLLSIGLHINPRKSQAIVINKGKLTKEALSLSNGDEITSIDGDERIRYLGCSFNSELVFDNKCIEGLNKNLACLSASPLLKPDQKLNIINQYVFPTLTYPLQTAPLNKVPQYVTNGLGVMIRRTVKEIIGLPMHTNDNLFYAPRRLRGLGLVKSTWEIYLQHFAISKRLSTIDDQLFQSISDCQAEMQSCIQALNVQGDNTKALRTALRQKSYEDWCNMKYQGSGVTHFQTHIKSNDFVCNKNSLSSSEWTAAIKLNSNYANLYGVTGVESASNLCRKCGREKETISHVTGSCPFNNQQIIARHHNVKHTITEILREISFQCFEEVYAIDNEGRTRFSDIIAFDSKSKRAFIVDPTVRYESSDVEQDRKIASEKETIYEKCIPFYAEKYANQFGTREWKVRGLWFGSRGSVGQSVIDFFNEVKLDTSKICDITEEILIKTIQIISTHIYS